MSRSWRFGSKAQPGRGFDKQAGRRQQVRSELAMEAGRLMYEEGLSHYFDAKRVAARRVFGSQGERSLRSRPALLPSNGEIRAALLLLADLTEGEGRMDRLHAMRLVALEVMEALPDFYPRLIGSVASGHIRRGSDIDLHVFAHDIDELLMAVDELGWEWDVAEVAIRRGTAFETYTHVYLELDYPVELSVYPVRDLRHRPRSSTDGLPIDRVSPPRLRAILAETLSETQATDDPELAE